MILLIGGGYTLKRVAALLPSNSFVITSRHQDIIEEFRSFGWNAEYASIDDFNSLEKLFHKYPSFEQLVDSVPPIHSLGDKDALIGVDNLCKLLGKSSINRLIYLSTTGVFGVEDGSWVNEETKAKPNNPKAKLRLESELKYRSYIPNVCAFRIAAIYGPGRGIGTSIKQGSYKLIRNFDRWSNRIQVDDLAKSITNALLSNKENSLPPVVCLSDNQPSLTSEVVSFYCKEFSLHEPSSIDREEVEKRQAWTMLSNQRISNKLLRETFLSELTYPTYKEGAKTEFTNQNF